MTSNKVESVLQVPEPLLKKVRRLNTWLKGIDNPAMTPVRETVRKDVEVPTQEEKAAVDVQKSNAPASSTSWVFTPAKDQLHTLKPGEKNFHESWMNIERYLQQRRQKEFIRRERCSCLTRKCKFVMGVGFLGSLVMIAIILIVYFVVFSKKGYMLSHQPVTDKNSLVYVDVASSSSDWENFTMDFSTFAYDTTTNNSPKATEKVFTTPSTLPAFLFRAMSVRVTSTEVQQSTTPAGLVPVTGTAQPDFDIINLLSMPGPLQRFS